MAPLRKSVNQITLDPISSKRKWNRWANGPRPTYQTSTSPTLRTLILTLRRHLGCRSPNSSLRSTSINSSRRLPPCGSRWRINRWRWSVFVKSLPMKRRQQPVFRHGCSNRSKHSGGRDLLLLQEEMARLPLPTCIQWSTHSTRSSRRVQSRPTKTVRTPRTLDISEPQSSLALRTSRI